MPNSGGDYYRGVGQIVEGLLHMSFSLSVKVYLCFVFHDICRLVDLERVWGNGVTPVTEGVGGRDNVSGDDNGFSGESV